MNDLINQINSKLDIVDIVSEYVPLSKKGKNFWGVCPFHQDSNPSMSVSPEKQIYKCFSCGASGGIVNFFADINKISFDKALAQLAAKIGIKIEASQTQKYTPEQQKLINMFLDATMYMQYLLTTEEGAEALEYAQSRNLSPRIFERFKIGYAAKHGLKEFLLKKGHDESTLINGSLLNSRLNDFFQDRLLFPISNEYGDVIGYSARALNGEEAKYINSAESIVFHKSSILYNYANAQDLALREKEIYICEGQMDVIALDKAGHANAVAVMGTALTNEHLRLLKNLTVILNFDSDNAGESATLKSVKLLLEKKFKVLVVSNSYGKDADEIFNKFGPEKLTEVLENRVTGLEWVYQKHLTKFGKDTPEQVTELIKSFANYLFNATSIEKDFYANKIARDLSLSIETINELLNIKPKYSNFRQEYKTPSKDFVPKQQVDVQPKVKKINYSYALIRSMLSKSFLIDIYIDKSKDVNFIDRQLIEIGKYLVAFKQGKTKEKPSPEIAAKVQEILSENSLVANNETEFNDIIKKVNNDFYEHYINEYKVKLKNELDEDKKISYLSAIVALKHKKDGK